MTDDSMICHDEDCQVAGCGARAQRRTCDDCGAEGLVTDCGHEAQPRPLAADGHGRMLCDDCAAVREVAQEVAARRPDLAANDAISAVLTADPSLTADEVIETLDEAAAAHARDVRHDAEQA